MPERRTPRATRPVPVRCAIYTRKSSDAGLEQAFNSLDAQREACAAYIASQQHEGWRALPTGYDDGGISGATLARPALQRLLADIEAGRVDVLVVYKVDRLTRALSDFAKLVELFDRHAVSFVSVTQQFNTTTSMGRLTLHVLLSFAQFEREVTGERIRDKIAASKQKGLWMGGHPPVGYDVQDRRLIVNAREAETVRSIFRRYRELGSVRALRSRLAADGVTGKQRMRRDGRVTGGTPFSRGALYYLLHNRLYRGAIVHHGTAYPGQHEAIIDATLWDEVQASLAAHTNGARREGPRQPSLLTGLVVDAEGEGLTPSHTVKHGRRYRYYVSRHLITEGKQAGRPGWRLPAADLETLVMARLREWLGTAAAVSALLEAAPQDASAYATLITHATRLAARWPRLAPAAATTYLHAFIRQVVIRPDRLTLEIDGPHARETLLASPERVPTTTPRRNHAPPGRPITIDIPAVLTRVGLGMSLVVPGAHPDTQADPCLIRLLLRAFAIQDRLAHTPDLTLQQLAEAEQVSASYVTRLLRLCYLAPDIVTAIVEGRQPAALTATTLMRDTRLPLAWAAQRARLGFASPPGHDGEPRGHPGEASQPGDGSVDARA